MGFVDFPPTMKLGIEALPTARPLMPGVEPQRVGAQQPAHPRHQVPVGRLNNQVKMIGHQTISVNLKTGLVTRFGQGFDEILPVHVRLKNIPMGVGPADYISEFTNADPSNLTNNSGRRGFAGAPKGKNGTKIQ